MDRHCATIRASLACASRANNFVHRRRTDGRLRDFIICPTHLHSIGQADNCVVADAAAKARRQHDEDDEAMKSKREADDSNNNDDDDREQLDQLLTKLLAVPKVSSSQHEC